MIPKVIHYCWLSEDPYPKEIKHCIDLWQNHLPDYNFVLWDTKRFDINSLSWTKQAFEAKKYAFAADYIRLYALYHYGGIYLDSDVLLYKSFDDLLDLPYFIGQDFVGAFEPAVIGCEPRLAWIKQVMEYYKDKDFIGIGGNYNIKNLPVVFFEQLFPKYNFRKIQCKEEFCYDNGVFNLFTPAFFNGRNNIQPIKKDNTYCSHLFVGSWSHKNNNRERIFNLFPKTLLNALLGLNYHFLRKSKVHYYDPIFRQQCI